MVRTRNQTRQGKESQENIIDDSKNKLLNNQNVYFSEEEIDEEQNQNRIVRQHNSPYDEARKLLSDEEKTLLENNNDLVDDEVEEDEYYKEEIRSRKIYLESTTTRKRKVSKSPIRHSSSRSTTEKSSPPKIQLKDQSYEKVKEQSSIFSKLIWLFSFIVLVVLAVIGFKSFMQSKNTMTYQSIIEQYKSDLPGYSKIIVETAIDKFNKQNEDEHKPVVLLLYGNNTKIKELYVKLADVLIRQKNSIKDVRPFDTIFDLDQLKHQYGEIFDTLKHNRMVLFNGLENFNGKDYLKLYGFVDDKDSHETALNSMIVISSREKVNRTEVDFYDVKSMEDYIKTRLRNRWNDIDFNNREAFINRLVSYVGIVL